MLNNRTHAYEYKHLQLNDATHAAYSRRRVSKPSFDDEVVGYLWRVTCIILIITVTRIILRVYE